MPSEAGVHGPSILEKRERLAGDSDDPRNSVVINCKNPFHPIRTVVAMANLLGLCGANIPNQTTENSHKEGSSKGRQDTTTRPEPLKPTKCVTASPPMLHVRMVAP